MMLTLLPESLFESPSDDVTRRERERPFGARVDDTARVVAQVAETVKKKVGQGAVAVTPDTVDDAVRQQSDAAVNEEFRAGRLPPETLGPTRDELQSKLKNMALWAFELAGGVTGAMGFIASQVEREHSNAQKAEEEREAERKLSEDSAKKDSASKDSTKEDSATKEGKKQKGSSQESKEKRRVWQVV